MTDSNNNKPGAKPGARRPLTLSPNRGGPRRSSNPSAVVVEKKKKLSCVQALRNSRRAENDHFSAEDEYGADQAKIYG